MNSTMIETKFDEEAALKLGQLIPLDEWTVAPSLLTSDENPWLDLISLNRGFLLQARFEGGILVNGDWIIDGRVVHSTLEEKPYLPKEALDCLKRQVNADEALSSGVISTGLFGECSFQDEVQRNPLAQFIEKTVDAIAVSRGLPIKIPGRYELEEDFGNEAQGPRHSRLEVDFKKSE